jgi:DNA-binding response OmpR family regulator
MGQESMVIEAIKSGAKDFIVKPFKPDRILKTVTGLIGSADSLRRVQMSFLSSMNISASAMTAQRLRLDIASQNITFFYFLYFLEVS